MARRDMKTYHPAPKMIQVEDKEPKDSDDGGYMKDVQMPVDIYSAPLAAAMGGLQVDLASSGKKRGGVKRDGEPGDTESFMKSDEYIQVHPILVSMLALPLFACQMIFLLALCVDARLVDDIYTTRNATVNGTVTDVLEIDPNSASLLVLKGLLIIILQIMVFQEMLEVLNALTFCINPTTWVDVFRENPDHMGLFKFAWKWPSLFLAAVSCVALKFVVAYLVTVESVSIILQAETVQDAIFNSLALTFIVEMDTRWWGFCSKVFRMEVVRRQDMDQESDDNYQFYIVKGAGKDGDDDDFKVCECETLASRFPELNLARVRDRLYKIFSRRDFGEGWKHIGGRQIERWLAFGILFYVYRRQAVVVFYALWTNVLPLTRDTCSYINWLREKYHHQGPLIRAFHWLRSLLLSTAKIDLVVLLNNSDHNKEIYEKCDNITVNTTDEHKHARMTSGDEARLRDHYGATYWALILTVGFIVIAPQFFGLIKRLTDSAKEHEALKHGSHRALMGGACGADDDEEDDEDSEGR